MLRFGHDAPAPVQGLVLAGGGARASFQIGALRYLYDAVGVAPRVVVGTSAGSIVAATLAQWTDPALQARALRRLETMWLGMQEGTDMFTPRGWFSRLLDKGPEWVRLLDREAETPEERRPALPWWSRPSGHHPDEEVVEELTGQAATLALATRDDPVEAGTWSASEVLQTLSTLTRLTRDGSDIATILRGADRSSSTHRAGPILAKLLDPEFFRSDLLSGSGMKVRIATVGLESGELRFMTESGTLVDRNNDPIGSSTFDVSKGVLASCSLPGVFRPVDLDGEHYVDGGVRENVPAEMAIGHLGVTHPYVVTCAPSGIDPAQSFAGRTMLDLASRAISILTDETERDEVAYARTAGAVVVNPEVSVHDAMTVDPGLLAINRDYGWMRAAQVHLGVDDADHDRVLRIVRARMHAWQLEKDWLAGSRAALDELWRTKGRIGELVRHVPHRLLPWQPHDWPEGIDGSGGFTTSDPSTWGTAVERHGHLGSAPAALVPHD